MNGLPIESMARTDSDLRAQGKPKMARDLLRRNALIAQAKWGFWRVLSRILDVCEVRVSGRFDGYKCLLSRAMQAQAPARSGIVACAKQDLGRV
jgi:hypothetical protein